MNANDNLKNDFIFFKNEILSDIKKIESKFTDKLFQINDLISQTNFKIENKQKDLYAKYDLLSSQLHEKKNKESFETALLPFKQKIEDSISKLGINLNILEKDFGNSCYKYDKIFSNNFNVPGLIGNGCPYDSLRPFLEYINLKITELLKAKEKQTFDLKKYKEKLETIINNNKTQFETAQNKINDYCKKGFKQCDINCIDRINLIEKRIEALRIENGKFSYELKQRSEELKIEWEKLDNMEKNLNMRFNEELEKFKSIVEMISKKVDKSKDQFNLIKLRFTELSDFIKDVRFRRNINNSFQERRQFIDMSNKIDFSKKQKIQRVEANEKKGEDENKDKDILDPFDYYSHFGIDKTFKEEEFFDDTNFENINKENIKPDDNKEKVIKENNNNENNIKQINNDIILKEKIENNFNPFTKYNNINESYKVDIKQKANQIDINFKEINIINKNAYTSTRNSPKIIRRDSKYKTDNYTKYQNKNQSFVIINDNYYPEMFPNFIIYNSSNSIFKNAKSHDNNNKKNSKKRNLKIKSINIKVKEKKTIKSENNEKNDNNEKEIININSDNKIISKNAKENEEVKNIPSDYKESTKLKDVVLGAKFKNNINDSNNKENLSQAYILMKKRSEEMQKVKTIYGGKPELKYHQMQALPSLKNRLKYSRNNDNNNILNQLNVLSNKDFKKGNIEDLYYTQLRKNKINQIMPHNNSLRSSSQDNIFFKSTLNRSIISKIYNNEKKQIFNYSLNNKNSMFMPHNIDPNRYYLNNN